MRNLILVTASALALSTAGIAVAHGFDGQSVKSASATFTATTVNNLSTVSCTGSDGNAYTESKATYSGTAVDASDPSLNGPFTFEATSLINTTNDGTVSGRLEINSGDSATDAQFTGVYHDGTIVGFAQGHEHGLHSVLLANLSASFSATGGLTSGLIGGGTAAGYAVEASPGQCEATSPPTPDKVIAVGAVSAVSATSITVSGVTCAVGSDLASQVANVHVGDHVAIGCTVANSATTLDKLSTGNGEHHDGQFSFGNHKVSMSSFGHFKLSFKK